MTHHIVETRRSFISRFVRRMAGVAVAVGIGCIANAANAQPLPCGTTIEADIAAAGESDSYTFQAVMGERVAISLGEKPGGTSSFSPVWRVIGPNGPVPHDGGFSGACAAGAPCILDSLPATAAYSIVVDSGNTATGPYSITMEAVSGTANGADNGPPSPTCARTRGGLPDGTQLIPCGTTVEGTIDVQGESDTYTFDAAVGERVVVSIGEKPGGSVSFFPSWKLYAPNGQQVSRDGGITGVCSGLCQSDTLTAAGTYTIVVVDTNNNGTGPYSITMEASSGTANGGANGPPSPTCSRMRNDAPDGTQPLPCGTTIEATIDVEGETDSYTFVANANERVVVSVGEKSGASDDFSPNWRLFGPNGQPVSRDGGTVGACTGLCKSDTLTLAGTYTIVVFDASNDGTGPYSISMEASSGTAGGVDNGPPSPTCARMRNDQPDGARPLPCGTTLEATIDVEGETDSYTFDVNANERVVVAIGAKPGGSSGFSPQWFLFAADGQQVGRDGGVTGSCGDTCASDTLTLTGTYTLVVFDSNNDDTGPYGITMEASSGTAAGADNGPPSPTCSRTRNGAPDGTQPLPCGTTIEGTIDVQGESDSYTFDAVVGERVVVSLGEKSGGSVTFGPSWKLYGPSGQLVTRDGGITSACSTFCRSDALTLAGTYTVVVVDSSNDGTGPYSISMESSSGTADGVSNGPPAPTCARTRNALPDGTQTLGCGVTASGTIDVVGETDSFTFAGTTGQRALITLTELSGGTPLFNPFWFLFAPNGVQVTINNGNLSACSGSCTSDALPADGVYTIVVFDSNTDGTGPFTLGRTVSGEVCACGNGVVNAGEQCDVGAANGTSGACCTGDCTFRQAGQTCRSAGGACDLAETCTGGSGTCPADGVRSSGAVCRSAAGVCDVADVCDGASSACPDVLASGAVCRSAVGICDVAETCNGATAPCPPDTLASSGTICRSAAGACDVAESCSGVSATCPADGVKPSTAVCRSAAGACDVGETCNGAGKTCGADGLLSSSTVCRSSTAACDPGESCSGSTATCPADVNGCPTDCPILSVRSARAFPGGRVTVPVALDPKGKAVAALNFDAEYHAPFDAGLRIDTCETGSASDAALAQLTCAIQEPPGEAAAFVANRPVVPVPTLEAGDVVELTFQVPADSLGQSFEVCIPPESIAFGDPGGLNVCVGTPQCGTIDVDGGGGCELQGDCNCDGRVNSGDRVCLVTKFFDQAQRGTCPCEDCNLSGTLDAADASCITRCAFGLCDPTAPAGAE
jgi:hypothetical protein